MNFYHAHFREFEEYCNRRITETIHVNQEYFQKYLINSYKLFNCKNDIFFHTEIQDEVLYKFKLPNNFRLNFTSLKKPHSPDYSNVILKCDDLFFVSTGSTLLPRSYVIVEAHFNGQIISCTFDIDKNFFSSTGWHVLLSCIPKNIVHGKYDGENRTFKEKMEHLPFIMYLTFKQLTDRKERKHVELK